MEAGRGIAALVVMLRHACVHAFEGAHPVAVVLLPSATAVMFFFVLSGTVMTLSYQSVRPGWTAAVHFLMHRCIRIYPTWWLTLFITLAMWPVLLKPGLLATWITLAPMPLDIPEILANVAVPTAWTLHWEAFYYLIFTAALLTRHGWLLFVAWFCIILAPAGIVADLNAVASSLGTLLHNRMGLLFLIGIPVGACIRWRPVPRSWLPALIALSVASIGYSTVKGYYGLFVPSSAIDVLIGALGIGALIIALVQLERNEAFGRVSLSAFRILGTISYPLYITHWLVMDSVYQFNSDLRLHLADHPVLNFLVMVAAALLFSALVSWAFDKPLQRLIKATIQRARRDKEPRVAGRLRSPSP